MGSDFFVTIDIVLDLSKFFANTIPRNQTKGKGEAAPCPDSWVQTGRYQS